MDGVGRDGSDVDGSSGVDGWDMANVRLGTSASDEGHVEQSIEGTDLER